MPFIKSPGLTGKLYVPEEKPGYVKKHPCIDCYSCQECTDERCRLCLHNKTILNSMPVHQIKGFKIDRFKIE